MTNINTINREVQIQEIYCTIKLEIKYYCRQKGKIIGIKKLNQNSYIYLVEFFDYNRIWATKQELKNIQD